jgi:hypothetical protein
MLDVKLIYYNICTIGFKVQNATFSPKSIYVLYVSQKNTSNFSSYSPQRLVFITEETSVYCAVRIGSSNIMH